MPDSPKSISIKRPLSEAGKDAPITNATSASKSEEIAKAQPISSGSEIPIPIAPLVDAMRAIQAKVASLGVAFTGAQITGVGSNDLVGVIDGFQQVFENCTIYYSPATGAHEVHGEILRKYQVIPAKGFNFGLPTTDETGTPDGVGRYNHFAEDASIYWHPNTGPMAIQGPVRQQWAAQGWELGAVGYPVRDVFSPAPGESAGDFQNGVLWIGPDGFMDAQVATMPPDRLLEAIWKQFDTVVHQSPDNVGLHPEKSLDSVSDTGYGFAQSVNRAVTVTIHGFRDNGLAPDTDFAVTMAILLATNPQPSIDEKGVGHIDHAIGATVTNSRVHAVGLAAQTIADRVQEAIKKASDAGITLGATIPDTAPLLSFKIGQDGSVNIFLSPTLAGKFAKVVVQQHIDAL